MLDVVAFATVLIVSVNAAAFTDLNCTNMDAANSKFVESATNCNDKYSTVVCATLFGVAVVNLAAVDRDARCNADAVGLNQDLKQLAISTCAKHCGYCCVTSEYNCDNKQFPRVRCETVTANQCTDPTWRGILAVDCPKSCGLCLESGCVDKAMGCSHDPAICRQVEMQEFVKENCQRTCGYCNTDTDGGGTEEESCADTSDSCGLWRRNRFCTNNFYTEAQRREYCGKTCNLCQKSRN